MLGRSPSVLMGNILFPEVGGQVGEGVACVWQERGCVADWTHELGSFGRLDGQHIDSRSEDKLVKVRS